MTRELPPGASLITQVRHTIAEARARKVVGDDTLIPPTHIPETGDTSFDFGAPFMTLDQLNAAFKTKIKDQDDWLGKKFRGYTGKVNQGRELLRETAQIKALDPDSEVVTDVKNTKKTQNVIKITQTETEQVQQNLSEEAFTRIEILTTIMRNTQSEFIKNAGGEQQFRHTKGEDKKRLIKQGQRARRELMGQYFDSLTESQFEEELLPLFQSRSYGDYLVYRKHRQTPAILAEQGFSKDQIVTMGEISDGIEPAIQFYLYNLAWQIAKDLPKNMKPVDREQKIRDEFKARNQSRIAFEEAYPLIYESYSRNQLNNAVENPTSKDRKINMDKLPKGTKRKSIEMSEAYPQYQEVLATLFSAAKIRFEGSSGK